MQQRHAERRPATGYTLVEMLVVMGIILLMVALVLVSIGSMLRGTKMANTVNLFVSAADEARTAGITLRRAVQVDLTRLDAEGRFNRLTTIGAYICDNFEGNTLSTSGTPPPPTNWNPKVAGTAYTVQDGTYCMYVKSGGQCYNSTFGIQRFEEGSEDYEALLQARVKFKQTARTATTWRLRLEGAVDTAYTKRYGVSVEVKCLANNPLNDETKVHLEKGGFVIKTTDLHQVGKAPGPVTTVKQSLIKEGIWYRIKLSIKRYTQTNEAGVEKDTARVAGKIWVDGQLEPPEWTVGPYPDDASPLPAGFGGFSCEGNDILVDDVFFDLRAIRPLPKGLRVDMLYPEPDTQTSPRWPKPDVNTQPIVNQDGPSPYNFPIVFRPDGTSAKRYIVRLMDLSTGDKRYVVVEQNTGRTRPADSWSEALGQ